MCVCVRESLVDETENDCIIASCMRKVVSMAYSNQFYVLASPKGVAFATEIASSSSSNLLEKIW